MMTFKAFCSPCLPPLPSLANSREKLLQKQQTSGKESKVEHEGFGQGCPHLYHLKLCLNIVKRNLNALLLLSLHGHI